MFVESRVLAAGFATMDHLRVRNPVVTAAAILVAPIAAMAFAVAPLCAQTRPATPRQAAAQPVAKAEKGTSSAKHEQAIVVLVNDEPITAYEIQQRAQFFALNTNIAEQVKANFQRLAQGENTNKQLRAILEATIQANQGKSREQIQAIFDERKKQFALTLQKQAIEGARAGLLPRFKKEAQEELIEERLKLQEAKRQGIEISEDEINQVMKSLAERNKMTLEQFHQHIKSAGVDPSTMRERFRAQFAWRDVVRRRFGAQVSITQREVDRMISATASEAGEDTVELQVHKITLMVPTRLDQGALARRYAEADGLRRRYGGCNSMASLAQGTSDARHDDMKFIKPSAIPEPTRSLLLSAKDGDMLPPTTAAAGIEVYAVCGRRAIKADDKQREKAEGELTQKEFEIVAKRHLRNLRQDAHIEYR